MYILFWILFGTLVGWLGHILHNDTERGKSMMLLGAGATGGLVGGTIGALVGLESSPEGALLNMAAAAMASVFVAISIFAERSRTE